METFEIYAEISKKQLKSEENGQKLFELPDGVILSRKGNSRALYFECDSEDAQKALMEILDDNDINWQKN